MPGHLRTRTPHNHQHRILQTVGAHARVLPVGPGGKADVLRRITPPVIRFIAANCRKPGNARLSWSKIRSPMGGLPEGYQVFGDGEG